MPSSYVDVRARIGLFQPSLIKILSRKALKRKTGSRNDTPCADSDSFTDFSFRFVVYTVCCAVFLATVKVILCEGDNGFVPILFHWLGGNTQRGNYTCLELRSGTAADAGQDVYSASFGCQDLLLLLSGDVETNPGPRYSSLRQTRLKSSSVPSPPPPSDPPSAPTKGATMRDVADLLGSVSSDIREMKETSRQANQALEQARATSSTVNRDDPPPTVTPPPPPTPPKEEQQTGDMMCLLQNLNRKFDDLKSDLSQLTDMCTVMQKEVSCLNDKVVNLERENEMIKKDNCTLRDRVDSLEEKTETLERQCKKNNVVFFGVNRKENETKSECEQAVHELLTDNLQIEDDVVFDNVYRINRKPNSPIIASVRQFCHKESILKASHKLKGSNVFVSEDFTARVRDIRRKLVPYLRDAKVTGKKVKLVYDHLVINGKNVYLGEDSLLNC